MKVGILTLPLHSNYGGNLQAWALMTLLKRMGHDVWFINRGHNVPPLWKTSLVIGKRSIQKFLLGRRELAILPSKEKEVIEVYSRSFIENNITPKTRLFRSSLDLCDGFSEHNFDAIIVGSDQVWRAAYAPNIKDYFLEFLGDNKITKRISYAASFGTDKWQLNPEQTAACRLLLKRFNAVSVREDSGVKLCSDKFGVEANHVLDPTMLLDKGDYLDLLPEGRDAEPCKRGVLVYILDMSPEKQKLFNSVAEKNNLQIFHVNSRSENSLVSLQDRIAPPVEDWLRGFRDAQFVVTDSFHACVFSILFKKDFIVVGNSDRGLARFNSLLSMFNLSDRMVIDDGKIPDGPINFSLIDQKIETLRINSLLFLQKALST